MKTAYIFLSYLTALIVFGLLRLVLVVMHFAGGVEDFAFSQEFFKSLAIGLQFDTCVSCYLLALPLLGILTAYFAKIRHKVYFKALHILTCTLFCAAFLISATDVPYFSYFFSHLNATVFSYFDSFGFLFRMIAQEPAYLVWVFVLLALCTGYVLVMNVYYRRVLLKDHKRRSLIATIPFAILCVGLCCIGIRGRIAAKSPLRVGTAYHCSDAFLNQVGLNANFALFKSLSEAKKTENRPLELIDSKEAEKVWQQQLRNLRSEALDLQLTEGTNVVVIIMESMSADKVGHFNKASRLTPCLDALIDEAFSFENCYSAGIHTYNGVYSTLFAHPALWSRHTMKSTQIPQMCGLPNNCADRGYQTLYFTTHDAQFDNIYGFLHANGVQKIISQPDYPKHQVKSTLGVSDHVMYEKAVRTLSSLDRKKPFFACLLSASDHGPYILPSDIPFKPKSSDIKEQMVEYADWAIGHFLSLAKKEEWFSRTLFVFIADHGYAAPNSKYEMPLSYHHTPFILYCPSQIPQGSDEAMALQIDLAPTVLSMLFSDYENNTLGIDLRKVEREYAFFCADNRLGVLDKDYFFIQNKGSAESLYLLSDHEKRNLIHKQPDRADRMRRYAYAMMQMSSDMLKSGTTSCH